MATLAELLQFTFVSETEVTDEVLELLISGESVQVAYKTGRDMAVVTNKRFIIIDKQGITGKKREIYTIPFKSINMYSSENAYGFDGNAEIQFWTKCGEFKLNLNSSVDIRKLDKIIATHIL